MRISTILALSVSLSFTSALAGEIPSAVTDTVKHVQTLIKAEASQVAVNESPMAGIYEAVIGNEIIYISADGLHFMIGDVYETKTRINITDAKRIEQRAVAINAVEDSELVVFSPKNETKFTINVFTDVDCPYCSKFHIEVPKLNEAGIKVRYFAFPRAGKGSKTYNTMVSVWCAKDQQQAMTDAKARRDIKAATCENPVQKQYELGQGIGITGTPALVFSDGSLVPGYVPAEKLIAYVEKSAVPFSKE